ncbi:MAG: hypothetical protein AAF787_12175 [Chloroflexota bacterium]
MTRYVARTVALCALLLTVAVLGVRGLAAGGQVSPLAIADVTGPDCFNACWHGIEIQRSDVNDALAALDTAAIPHDGHAPQNPGIINTTPEEGTAVLYLSLRFQSVVRMAFYPQACPLDLLAALGLPDKIDTAGSGPYFIYREGIMIGVRPVATDERFVVELISREQASAILAIGINADTPPVTWDRVRALTAEGC